MVWDSTTLGLIGTVIVALAGFFSIFAKERLEEKRRMKVEERSWELSRNDEYYKFIEMFSTKYSGKQEDINNYLKTALGAAKYGNVILSNPVQVIGKDIKSLDDLVMILFLIKNNIKYDPEIYISGDGDDSSDPYTYTDKFGEQFETLRVKVAKGFAPTLINLMRSSRSQGKSWWQVW